VQKVIVALVGFIFGATMTLLFGVDVFAKRSNFIESNSLLNIRGIVVSHDTSNQTITVQAQTTFDTNVPMRFYYENDALFLTPNIETEEGRLVAINHKIHPPSQVRPGDTVSIKRNLSRPLELDAIMVNVLRSI